MYVSVRHDKLGNLKQHKKRQRSIIMAHCHRVLGVRALTPFDLRLGLGGVGGSWWGCLAHSVLRGIWGVALVFVWGCAQLGGGGVVCFSGIFC